MFIVKHLEAFPKEARPFTDEAEVRQIVTERGLQLDDTICTSCPAMSPGMQLPHLFAHIYAGLEMLERGKQEWQMCQILHCFVKENLQDLSEDTQQYFSTLPGKQSVARYAWSLSCPFQKPDACQVYLFARACNAHTRVHFANCVWSTLDDKLSYYVVVDIAVIGKNFVPLKSVEKEMFECVVGEVQFLMDPDAVKVESEGSSSDGVCSDVDVALALDTGETESVCGHVQDDENGTRLSSVRVEHFSHQACLQLSALVKVNVERLSQSALHPGVVFKAAQKNKSELFPGKIFKGCHDWSQCTVPCEKKPISLTKPGFLFSAHSKPREKPSRSLLCPGRIFKSSGVLPASLDPQLRVTKLTVKRPCVDNVVRKFNCLVCETFVADSHVLVKRHVESTHSMYTCRNAHCVAGFQTAQGRDMHSSVHMKKSHSCPQCDQVFSHRYSLARHMVCHAKVRKHCCLQCGCKYFRPQDLKEHLRTTHNAFTYPCQQCSYVGQSMRALKQHSLVHEAPKLKCDKCAASFHWHLQLALHVCS